MSIPLFLDLMGETSMVKVQDVRDFLQSSHKRAPISVQSVKRVSESGLRNEFKGTASKPLRDIHFTYFPPSSAASRTSDHFFHHDVA